MEKETFIINYKGSGIKTTRMIADIQFLASILSTIVLVIVSVVSETPLFLLYALISLLSGYLILGVLRALATIAENSLVQRIKTIKELRNDFYIEEK